MRMIVCLDDKNGMAFHNRRQSSDLIVTEKILELSRGCTLWMNNYSGYLFANTPGNIQVAEDFLDKAEAGDCCFAEITDIRPFMRKVRQLYVFRWNRVYPADLRFPQIPAKPRVLAEFSGNSHEKITLEEYCL
ncbi:MAG: ribonuclease Z [Oscillospiraceae bacterium]|nr:ribonuclease Z [Oscillospiraceae bacterium]